MKIEIAFKRPMRRWQYKLAAALRARGHDVSLAGRGRRKLAFGVAGALAVQQRLLGPRPSLFDALSADQPGNDGVSPPELVIALDGVDVDAGRVLEPFFDGARGDDALIAALTGGGSPLVEMRLDECGVAYSVVSACLAIEERSILSRSLDQTVARVVTLLLQSVERFERGNHIREPSEPSPRIPSGPSPLAHIADGLARKILGRLSNSNRRPNHWRVGYRLGGTGISEGAWSKPDYTILPDDGSRFYADPIPFEHEGRRYIFLEDYPYATGKALIAVVEIDEAGRPSAPRTVLEQPCHLSYPYIIRHGGEIYMMPEMSGARRVQLFRADLFPDRWVADRVLLDDIVASDATLIEHDGRWWMFATLSDDGGSTWDQLCLFHAPDLLGPWTPHIDNPVLVDAGSARPAGAMWHENGQLMRVAQDCRTGYGVGLAICRVDRLDLDGFEQTVVSRLEPPEGYGADGVHTFNRAGGLEVIDLRFSSASRSDAPSRYPAVPH